MTAPDKKARTSARIRVQEISLLPPRDDPFSSGHHLYARAADAEDLIEGTLTYHDRHQFEVKLAYIVPADHSARYRVQTYFFIPINLDINPRTYAREMFYRNLQDHIRFKTPSVSLDKLVDPANERSPLNRVRVIVERLKSGVVDKAANRTATHELKLFGCIFRSSMRDGSYKLLSQVQKLERIEPDAESVIVDQICAFGHLLVQNVERCLESYRAFRNELTASGVPASLGEDFESVDEYLSIVVEEHLNLVYAGLKSRGTHESLAILLRRIRDRIFAEEAYRRGCGYLSVMDRENAHRHEGYSYRRGSLKKYVSSILYLTATLKEDGTGFKEMALALAAGLAMLVAALISMWAGRVYNIDSTPFVVILVVGYMIKDRIKEWGRSYLGSKVSVWTADYTTAIRDPFSKSPVGTFRQMFRFVRESGVPDDVLKARNRQRVFQTQEESDPESILRYEKQVHLDVSRMGKERARFHHIHDILRFNISNFLLKMDEPNVTVHYLDPQTEEQIKLVVPKVYHVNVVLRLLGVDAEGNETSFVKRVRLVLNKEGIKRVEEVR